MATRGSPGFRLSYHIKVAERSKMPVKKSARQRGRVRIDGSRRRIDIRLEGLGGMIGGQRRDVIVNKINIG